MDAEEILSSYLDRKIFTDGHNLSDLDILKCMEEYHLAKSKEEAEERYRMAVEHLAKEWNWSTSDVKRHARITNKALCIASGKESS